MKTTRSTKFYLATAAAALVLVSAAGCTATTGSDGRISWLSDLDPGVHVLELATGEWFAAAERATFFPIVTLTIALETDHTHVAVLLSPYSYTSYRGS